MTDNHTSHSTLQTHPRAAWWWIATWFGSGLSPKASGTAGSLVALPFAFIIQYYGGNYALFFASVVIFFVGWWASCQYLKHYSIPDCHPALVAGAGLADNSARPRYKNGVTEKIDDPKEIVVDEVAGMWLSIWILSSYLELYAPTVTVYIIAFASFRFFDALKPFPISLADRKIKGGFGVMFDDILAALFSIIGFFVVYIGMMLYAKI